MYTAPPGPILVVFRSFCRSGPREPALPPKNDLSTLRIRPRRDRIRAYPLSMVPRHTQFESIKSAETNVYLNRSKHQAGRDQMRKVQIQCQANVQPSPAKQIGRRSRFPPATVQKQTAPIQKKRPRPKKQRPVQKQPGPVQKKPAPSRKKPAPSKQNTAVSIIRTTRIQILTPVAQKL